LYGEEPVRNRVGRFGIIVGMLGLLACIPVSAGRFIVRAQGVLVTGGGEATASLPVFDASTCTSEVNCHTVDLSDGTGYGLNVEFRVTSHLFGIEVGMTDTKVDGNILATRPIPALPSQTFSNRATFTTDFDTFYVGANFHLWKRDSRVDVYIGPIYANVDYGDGGDIIIPAVDLTVMIGDTEFNILMPEETLRYTFEDTDSFGINGGFDIAIGKRWAVSVSARYLISDPEYRSSNVGAGTVFPAFDAEIDPIFLSVGAGFRF